MIDIPEQTIDALKRHHQSIIPMDYLGTCQAVSVDAETNTTLDAVSDLRKFGSSAGY